MKKWLFVFVLFSLACMGQSEDALILSIAKETNKEKKVALQFELVNYYSDHAQFEESIEQAKKILSLNQIKSRDKASYLIAKSYIAWLKLTRHKNMSHNPSNFQKKINQSKTWQTPTLSNLKFFNTRQISLNKPTTV